MLDSAGQLYVANLRSAEQTDTYLPADSADGVTYMPRFTFHGFRYVEVRGYPGDLPPDALQAWVIGSDTPRIGVFSCGHPLVNQLYQNIIWGQRGNFISIPTDCPQRDERLGWLGDAHIFARTAAYNMDVAAFFTKWMHDVLDEQSANGAFSDAAPRVMLPSNAAPAWGDAGVIVPWTMYRMYGDKHIIETSWEAMTRWMAYLRAANPDGLRLARSANNYGDWLALDGETENHLLATRTPKDLLATAYYAYTAWLMAEMARAINLPDEAVVYETLHMQIVQAFVTTYVQPDGRILSETQTSYVLALAFDLLPCELRAEAARYLVEDIQLRGWHLATGFVGVGYLLPVLTELGYADVAYRLLLQESYPSWGYSIRQGATTIWERWDGWTEEHSFQDPAMNSFYH
jgi:alpha-L-rhamnosidase